MARPKKEPADTKTITVGFADYVRMQNFLARHLQVQQSMASRMMTAASSQLGAINATLSQVQSNTKAALQLSNIGEKEISHDDYQHIAGLLADENAMMAEPAEGLGEMQLPIAPPLPTPAKKQRKQRAPKDPNAPKRPVTAFFLFLAENKEATARSMPNSKPGEIQQRNRDMWNSLNEEKQEKYKRKYRENFEEYKEHLRAYKAKGGNVDEKDLEPADDDDAEVAPTDTEAAKASSTSSDSSDEEDSDSDSSEAPSPQKPRKEVKAAPKVVAKPVKEASPEKKKKPEKEDKKKRKSEKPKPVTPESSPEPPPKKRKAEVAEAEAGTDEKKKKKKKRKSQGYGGNTADF